MNYIEDFNLICYNIKKFYKIFSVEYYMNLNYLHYLRVLARTEHYGKAAQELYISQPSLSYAIAMLEQDLGTKLFEKKGRNIKLTKYGHLFAQSVESSLSELEYATEKLQKLSKAGGGHIELSYYHTLGINFIPEIIKKYINMTEYSTTTFSLYQASSEETIRHVLNKKADIGFCSYVDLKKFPQLEKIPVNKEYFHIVVPKDHPLTHYKQVSLKILSKYPFVAFSKKSGLRPIIDNIFQQWNINCSPEFEAEQGSSVAGIVAAGLGITLLPDIPLPKMNIKKIKLEESIPPRITYMTTVKNQYISEAAEHFKEFIKINYICTET